MSNDNKRENRKKLRNILMGALSVLPGATVPTSAAEVMRAKEQVNLTATEEARKDEATVVSRDEIYGNRQMIRFIISKGFDKDVVADDDMPSKVSSAVDAIDKIMVLCDAVLASLKKFDSSVDSAFASGAWQDPPNWLYRLFSSWNAQQYIDSQKNAWLGAIKELQNVQSKLENVAQELGNAGKKFVEFYSDKKSANNDIAFQGNVISSMLDNIRQGIETQKAIDVPETGDKAEAKAWRVAMQSLRRLKSSTSGDISSCVNSTKSYLSRIKESLENLPKEIEQISEKIEGDLKTTKTNEFMKKLAAEKRQKAADIARKEEEEKLRKENEEKARVEREKKRKEEEEEREREKAERERIEREEKEKAEREEQERLAKMREDFDGTRKKLISSLRDKIEKRKVYWDNITNPSDKTNADIAEILKSKFNVEHEKLDAAGRAKLSEMEAISEFSEDNLAALKELNEYPSQFGQKVSDLNSAVSSEQEALIKQKGDLLQFKSDTLDEIASKKEDFTGYVANIGLTLRKESQPVFNNNIEPTQKSIVLGFDDLKSKLQSIEVLLTDKKLDDKINALKQAMDGLLKKVELSKQNVLNQGLKIKKDEVIKSLKSKQAIVVENWKKISDYKPSDMPDKLKPYATRCLQAASDRTKLINQGLKNAIKNVEAYSLTDIHDEALDEIDVKQSDEVSNHSAFINMLCERITSELERFRADRKRMRLWDKIFGNLPLSEAQKDVQRIRDEEGLSLLEAIKKSVSETFPGTDQYNGIITDSLYRPANRGQWTFSTILGYGPPGTGKSATVIQVAQAAGIPLVRLTKESFDDGGERLAKNIISSQNQGVPVLIIMDEADSLLAAAKDGQARKDTVANFLTMYDTLKSLCNKGNIVLVFTSNAAPSALEPAVRSRINHIVQLGNDDYLVAGISKLLEPVRLNQSMSRESAINDIAGAIRTANMKAASPREQVGFRTIKQAVLDVCNATLAELKSQGSEVDSPIEQDEWAPNYDLTEADVAIDPERIIQRLVEMTT